MELKFRDLTEEDIDVRVQSVNANCTVSIYDSDLKEWISKEDTGTESSTEAEKGLASDSFKRACFNWGIGRELYTAPFIWIPSEKCNINQGKCFDKFRVEKIKIENKKITGLAIWNDTKNIRSFVWHPQQKGQQNG